MHLPLTVKNFLTGTGDLKHGIPVFITGDSFPCNRFFLLTVDREYLSRWFL
jgi:hypothetical protein